MVCRGWTLALLALGAAVAMSDRGVRGDHPRFRLRVRVVQPSSLVEDDSAELSDSSMASSCDNDRGDSEEPDEPDADDGPDGIGDGYDIDWTNWSWPNDVTPDMWGDAVGPFGQCGGVGYKGNETCVINWVCAPLADSFSECLPKEWVTTLPNSTVVVTPMPTNAASSDGSLGADTPTVPATQIPANSPTSNSPTTDSRATESPSTSSPPSDSPGTDSGSDHDGDGGDGATASPPRTEAPTPHPTPSPSSIKPSANSPEPPAPVTTEPVAPGIQFESVPPWQQCGGRNFNYHQYATGPFPQGDATELQCSEGYQCDVINEWFFQCVPIHDPSSAALWSQCGGAFHQGLTNCVAGSYCKFFNDWYSQCLPTKLR
ncbi:hypothetical protein PybrP1_013209 [[Pythium] brassicae (nom. inval.)]|nr:hypothetical protein PybrP1_013209 [[Pythium] brassicae (nom. inval.)]